MTGLIMAISGSAQNSPAQRASLRRLIGPGLLVAVGCIDPGNWATDIAGGSGHGYNLLTIVLGAGLLALCFQLLVSRLAVVTGNDLATLTAKHLPAAFAKAAWLAGEAAILATALAELLGGAIALRLLFGLPLMAGVIVTAFGTMVVLMLARGPNQRHEKVVSALLGIVAFSFLYLLFESHPDWHEAARGLTNTGSALRDPGGFMIALGILGATLMPHNLYLHSGALAKRAEGLDKSQRAAALRLTRNDTAISLGIATAINAAIMIVAAASLTAGGVMLASLDDAHRLIGLTLGSLAALVFAVALYAAGQSSAVTGVMAGQIISRGFRAKTGSPARRAILTRIAAGSVAIGMLYATGSTNPDTLLVLTQVVLSLALPFALVPLVWLVMRRDIMGDYALRGISAAGAMGATALISGLNLYLLVDTLS